MLRERNFETRRVQSATTSHHVSVAIHVAVVAAVVGVTIAIVIAHVAVVPEEEAVRVFCHHM